MTKARNLNLDKSLKMIFKKKNAFSATRIRNNALKNNSSVNNINFTDSDFDF